MRPITAVWNCSFDERTPSSVPESPLPSIINATPRKSAHIDKSGEVIAGREVVGESTYSGSTGVG